MKVAPVKLYEYTVYFHETLGRWFAKFSSTRADVGYEFPLADVGPLHAHEIMQLRPHLTPIEEEILGLVFVHMVATLQSHKKVAE